VNLSNWYRVLGVREDAGKEEIVAAYRRRIGEYHPDKVARMGEEIRAVADRKTQQINAAYEIGMRLFR
jgi:DnaJ like chaperone protein